MPFPSTPFRCCLTLPMCYLVLAVAVPVYWPWLSVVHEGRIRSYVLSISSTLPLSTFQLSHFGGGHSCNEAIFELNCPMELKTGKKIELKLITAQMLTLLS